MRNFLCVCASALTFSLSALPSALSASPAASSHTKEQTQNLANFDDLDFNVYTHQKWDELRRSHASDIIVHYPDGTTTIGLPDHLDRLKPMFVFAPDTRITAHPMRLADGDFTAVQGIFEGTFSKPMPLGGGKLREPNGKTFRLDMLTVARWENGVMKEEWLYWDNLALLKQIGMAD